jgi:hypothetical protein
MATSPKPDIEKLTREYLESLCVVLAFDPGETTGWCSIGVEPNWFSSYPDMTNPRPSFVHYSHGQIDCVSKDLAGWFGTAQKHAGINMAGENAGIESMIALACILHPKSVVVIEDFIPDMKRMDQARHTLSPVRITAGFSFGMSQNSANGRLSDERIFIQNRSLAKTTCTDERLKNWGMYEAGSGAHARDATRHAYYFLRDCVGLDHKAALKRHLAWPHLFEDPADVDYEQRNQRGKRKLGEII